MFSFSLSARLITSNGRLLYLYVRYGVANWLGHANWRAYIKRVREQTRIMIMKTESYPVSSGASSGHVHSDRAGASKRAAALLSASLL